MQASGEREPAKLNITGGVQLLTRDAATGRYGVKEVRTTGGACRLCACGEGLVDWDRGMCCLRNPHPFTHHTQVFLADGSGLSGVSAAVRLPGGAERYLLGSWSDRGVLLCTRTGIKGQPGGKEEL